MKLIPFAIALLLGGLNAVLAESPSPAPAVQTAPDNAKAAILCYHRFEEQPRDGLAITPARFEEEMQAIRDAGITVIPMADFLAWQRGEKSIPARAAVLTIDDGYVSGYNVAWPILKKFGYPFTMYIYTDYVKGGPRAGGGSMTWDQLAEMRDAGVDIGSHTISHSSLTSEKGKTPEEYQAWLHHELADSKAMLESKLGIPIRTIAYPYGNNNDAVRKVAAEVGYEAGFSVRGAILSRGGDPMGYGRTAIDSTKPALFTQALNFGGSAIQPSGGAATLAASTSFPTIPADGQIAAESLPELSVDLSGAGTVDPSTLVMRVSGLGEVPATYDPATGHVRYQLRQRLYADSVNVSVAAKSGGNKVAAAWSYRPAQ